MSKTERISVTLPAEDLRWLRARARRQNVSVSALLVEATRLLRKREAMDRLVASFGDDANVLPHVAEEIRGLWRG